MKLFKFLIVLFVTACFFWSCSEHITKEESTLAPQVYEVFTLTATYGQAMTKVFFDEDGLGLQWQPGDVLYLIDIDGKKSTVTMKTDIETPSKTATFKATSNVLSGHYLVLYGSDNININVIFDVYGYIYPITITDNESLSNRIRMYGELTVTDGQTSADIVLSQSFVKLTFKFQNLPSGITNMNFGIACSKDGLANPIDGIFTTSGYVPSSYVPLLSLGWNNGANGTTLLAPTNLSGQKVFFFLTGVNSNSQYVAYEFVKDGKDLKAGMNYNVSLDFSNPTHLISITKSNKVSSAYSITTVEQLRLAGYLANNGISYSIESDIDLNNETVIPIVARTVNGNNHILHNLVVNYGKCSSIGFLSTGGIENICIKKADIIGKDKVGSFVGEATALISKCTAEDVVVKGAEQVGGAVGYCDGRSIKNCVITGNSSVSASTNHVGGIIGYHLYGNLYQCGYEGSVSGDTYVGGIAGMCYGYGSETSQCYSKGSVSGNSYVGGLCGSTNSTSSYVLQDSYHIGSVTCDNSDTCGGLIGYSQRTNIYNCYSYGDISSNFGVSPNCSSSSTLTSCTHLTRSETNDNCNCGPNKTFFSKLSVINGNEAFSTQVWEGIDAKCPLLGWQSDLLNGGITLPGFGDENW